MLGWRWMILLVGLQCHAIAGVVWQPVMDYSLSFSRDRPGGPPPINPFENFTHLGTDFGWMGPGETRIESKGGAIRIKDGTEWTGLWASLAGLAIEGERELDPTDLTGLGGAKEMRTPIRAVTIDVRGKGEIRLELADVDRRAVWERRIRLTPGDRTRQRFEIQAGELGELKFLNWIAEPGCEAEVLSVGFEVERPEIGPEAWMFRVSLGKLRRCHDPGSGLTRDRAHVPPGVFDSVASSGMHALASAAAAAEGVLDREMVVAEVRKTAAVLLGLPKAGGFLPHFTVRREDGSAWIHPGTEFSTVDTAIALQGLRLAANILNLADVSDAVAKAIDELDFDLLTDPEGWISHGMAEDGKTPLIGKWKDWGGESALVLTTEAMVSNRMPQGRMEPGGKPFRGVGFIAEIQSLFYPDFDRSEPDLIGGTVWPKVRRDLLARQAAYVNEQWPGSPAANAGIFGVSAGEAGMPGAGYTANGVDLPGLRWLHPHAMVMTLALSGGSSFGPGIQRLEQAGLLFPEGLPENVETGLVLHNPMQGSLNAAFETLASYHGWRRAKGGPDVIDQACLADPLMRKGAARFYR
jgi:hypothetical protein